MSAHLGLDRRAPEEIREQIAIQLELDKAHLAGIPPAGLYRLQEQLLVDELTGVLTRRAGMAAVSCQVESARRSRRPQLVAVFLDVDGLKSINDGKGHVAGDRVLRAVAEVLRDHVREEDVVFRYGGDEFVCALPHLGLELAAARLQAAWHAFHDRCGQSFSAGFAELRIEDDAARLIARADECLCAGRPRAWRPELRVVQ